MTFADHQNQACLRSPFDHFLNETNRVLELIGAGSDDRPGAELVTNGLFVDLPAWGQHVFSVTAAS